MYRVLRSYLRNAIWPASLSVAVLSAKYGLIGGLASIEMYDQRMDRERAAELAIASTDTLIKWGQQHRGVSLVLGKDYLPALNLDTLRCHGLSSVVVDGSIGIKQSRLRALLYGMERIPRRRARPLPQERPLYFLPDWDDMLDTDYDFRSDKFSSPDKATRAEQHCVRVMQPERMCDGVLVSLAQHLGTKGALKKFAPTDIESLAPDAMRDRFGLAPDQWLFGDCGAFSYANEPVPTITTEQAVSLYQIYGFDFGASVDHIPFPEIVSEDGTKKFLTEAERAQRVKLTYDNAAAFLTVHKARKCTFTPVGVIQGLTPENYAKQVQPYVEMGYTHLALGGLVPLSDAQIVQTIQAIGKAKKQVGHDLWIHLFGVFRPKIQQHLRDASISSFDSATYFRKAWLRSGQNYCGVDGKWYAAIRVPMTSDPRTRKRLESSGIPLPDLQALERIALQSLYLYSQRQLPIDKTLQAIKAYDFHLNRSEDHGEDQLLDAYKRTLEARPWEMCMCPVCATTGIDALIFRGANRNKRRGAHNTLMLYRSVTASDRAQPKCEARSTSKGG